MHCFIFCKTLSIAIIILGNIVPIFLILCNRVIASKFGYTFLGMCPNGLLHWGARKPIIVFYVFLHFVTVVLQLSQFSPSALPCPPIPRSHSQSPPWCLGSFIFVLPPGPSPSFLLYSPPHSPLVPDSCPLIVHRLALISSLVPIPKARVPPCGKWGDLGQP